MSPFVRATCASLVLALIVTADRVVAAPVDESAAEAAFVRGRALMKQGRYEEASKSFETSLALEPALGTLLNLAESLERNGRNASAWIRYREAAGMALRLEQREREAIAREKAAELEPSLCHLIVRVPRPDAALEVRRDGAPLDPSAFELPVPVDPGSHVIEATEPGSSTARRYEVDVPASEAGHPCPDVVVVLDRGVAADAPSTGLARAANKNVHNAIDRRGVTAGRAAALVLGAAGVVGVGVGTGFAISAASTKSDADAFCSAAGCTARGHALLADAGGRADIATASFIAGALVLAAGAALWFIAAPPSDGKTAASTVVQF